MAAEDGSDRVVAGRYTLRRLLGRGGMGSVWLATDGVLGRDVALKEVTFPVLLTDQERNSLRERTLREARAAARFEHAQVTTVHDVIEEDGRPWIVMEHGPSRTLSELVSEHGPLPVDEVVRIGLDVLAALSAAHRAGIVHRDVKPANVLVGEQGRAWLTDFGIATTLGDEHLTGHGVLLGSPPYIAPERARGDEPGPPADLWALGATLFTAVEGRPPFERGEPMATLLAAATEEPPPARRAGALEPLLRALLTKDPAQRITAEQARAALSKVLDEAGRPAPEQVPQHVGEDRSRDGQHSTRPPRGPDAASPAPGEGVERIDLSELSLLAAAATKAVAGTAVRKMARRAARAPEQPEPQRPPPPAGAQAPQPNRRRRSPPAGAQAPQPNRRASRRAQGKNGRGSWRFKRRWVVVPLLLFLALAVGLLSVAGLLLQALFGGR